jgi:hypothetical protein
MSPALTITPAPTVHRSALALLLALSAATFPARAEEKADLPDGFEAWGKLGPSPYYPPDGLQSPIRDNGLHLGGDVWIDSGYEESRRELEGEPDMAFWLVQGRFMLDATATYTFKRFFAQAKGQLLAHIEEIPGNEYVDTDDAWIRFGMWDLWDLQFGRFEAWEVYHKGEGLERDTLEDAGAYDGPDIYEVNYAFYRQDGFGQLAAHAYPLEWLRFELASVLGNELGFNSLGARATGILDLSWLKVKLAGEYRKLRNREEGKLQWEEKRGFGGGVQVNLDQFSRVVRVHFGANSAWGLVDRVDAFGKVDERGSPDTFSAGGFVNVWLWSAVLGAGYNHTLEGDRQLNDITGRVGHFEHQQAFASIRHPLVFPWLQAKLVFAWANADLEPSFDNPRVNDMFSVRLRLSMVF